MHSVGVALLSLIFALHNVKSDSVAFIEQEVVAVQSIKLNIKESDRAAKQDVTCIKEGNMDFSAVTMADTDKFKEETLAECVNFCLKNEPSMSHVLINYYDSLIFSDTFNCICSPEYAFKNSKVLSESQCDTLCPKSHYKCGDAKDRVLSVYCLKPSCLTSAEPICSKRLPHDAHGCVHVDKISWAHAHNVRNFSAGINGHSACVWECHDHHPSAMYSLTRTVDNVLTCSCGYIQAFEPMAVVNQEFCKMIPGRSQYYTVNCINDLSEDLDEDNQPKPEDKCKTVLPIGCIYEELIDTNMKISISNLESAEQQLCHHACSSAMPTARHVAVKWNDKSGVMECICLRPNDWKSTQVGPWSACDIPCKPEGSGLECGGPRNLSAGFPAFSLYCLHQGDESVEITKEDEDEQIVLLELNYSKPLMRAIAETVDNGLVISEVLVALLSLICLVLIGLVTFLCLAKGISSLSKDVM